MHLIENKKAMTSAEILKMPLLDLVFENRNKLYGAYALRKQYNQRLFFAMCISVITAALLLCIMIKNSASVSTNAKMIPDEVVLHTVTIPKPPKAPEPPQAAKPQRPAAPVAQITLTQPRITNDPRQIIEVPTQSDLTDVAISNKTSDGVPASAVPAIAASGNETKTKSNEKPATGPAYLAPEFPGGAAAWAHFLSRYLQVPQTLEAGEKKSVLVKFLVREDGTVTCFDVVQSGGAVFDAEVIRYRKKCRNGNRRFETASQQQCRLHSR